MKETYRPLAAQRSTRLRLRAAVVAALPLVAAMPASAWEKLGGDVSSVVNSLAVDSRGMVYAGGQIVDIGGAPFGNLAQWDGATWSDLDGGANDEVKVLSLDSTGNLYVGGVFSEVGSGPTAADGIAKWNGTAWSAVDGGVGSGGQVWSVVIDGSDNLYAGGLFSAAGAAGVSNVAKLLAGGSWAAMDAGLNDTVLALALGSTSVYAGGGFTTPSSYLAVYGSGSWQAPSGASPSSTVNALAFDEGASTLYIGESNGDISTLAGSTWSLLGAGSGSEVAVRGLALDSGGNLFVSGDFTGITGVTPAPQGIARWDGSAWSALGLGQLYVMSVAADKAGNVYAAAIDGVYIDTRRAMAGIAGGEADTNKRCVTVGLAYDPDGMGVTDIFGDDIPGDYCANYSGASCTDSGSEWAAWRWDAATSAYVGLATGYALKQGEGYFVCRNPGAAESGPVSLKEEYGAGATPLATNANCTVGNGFPNGCFEIPLVAPAAGQSRHNLVSHPFSQRLDLSRVKVEMDGATLLDFGDGTYTVDTIWKMNGYGNAYDSSSKSDGYLLPMEAFWVKLLPDAAGHTFTLLIPKP